MVATYGTLATLAGFPMEVTIDRRGASTPAETGFITARTFRKNVAAATWSNSGGVSTRATAGQPQTRTWRLLFGPTDFSALLASFDAAMGAALPLLWTPPPPDDAGGAIPVRFVSGTLRVRRGPGPVYQAEAEIEEYV